MNTQRNVCIFSTQTLALRLKGENHHKPSRIDGCLGSDPDDATLTVQLLPTLLDAGGLRKNMLRNLSWCAILSVTSMFFQLVASICHVAVSFLFMIVWIKGFRNSSTIETPEPENARSASGLLMIQCYVH